MKQKIVIKVTMKNEKMKSKCMHIVVGLQGVTSVTIEKENDKITVIGEGIDVACLVMSLRKKFCNVEIISVEEVKPPPPPPPPIKCPTKCTTCPPPSCQPCPPKSCTPCPPPTCQPCPPTKPCTPCPPPTCQPCPPTKPCKPCPPKKPCPPCPPKLCLPCSPPPCYNPSPCQMSYSGCQDYDFSPPSCLSM